MDSGNFYDTLRRRMASRLGAPMLTLPDGSSLTYGDMDARAGQMAGVFLDAGAQPGDRILVQAEKSTETVAAYLGAIRAGLVYVPLNTAYTDDEVEYFLGDASPSILVCDSDRETRLTRLTSGADVKMVYTLGVDASLSEAADGAEPMRDIQPRHSDDIAVILYTSGTTGRSKGAMLSHGALAANALALNELWRFSKKDVLLHALPIFHIHGLFVALHTAMLSACEILFLPKFHVGEVRKALARATVLMGVPTFYTRLLADGGFDRKETEGVRLFISGSAPLSEETFNAFEERTGQQILERYGMSEAGMIASNPVEGDRVAGTVGFALPGVALRITDDHGACLPPNAVGGLEIQGDSLFKGYWRMPEKTAAEFRDGWFVTGDVGRIDETGRLALSGRAKDLIIAGGYNVYPKEVEAVLDAIPGVAESAVVGAPHPDMGEGVVAVLVAETDPLEPVIVDQALQRLAKFKRPRKIYWVNALPRNAMGKVQKQKLREQFSKSYQGGD